MKLKLTRRLAAANRSRITIRPRQTVCSGAGHVSAQAVVQAAGDRTSSFLRKWPAAA